MPPPLGLCFGAYPSPHLHGHLFLSTGRKFVSPFSQPLEGKNSRAVCIREGNRKRVGAHLLHGFHADVVDVFRLYHDFPGPLIDARGTGALGAKKIHGNDAFTAICPLKSDMVSIWLGEASGDKLVRIAHDLVFLGQWVIPVRHANSTRHELLRSS